MFFFFFKQKTAYEMRISDWSSDVCSSDLGRRDDLQRAPRRRPGRQHRLLDRRALRPPGPHERGRLGGRRVRFRGVGAAPGGSRLPDRKSTRLNSRSLMRISYAVFCLKKKKHKYRQNKPMIEV